jgi:hypothetical protein
MPIERHRHRHRCDERNQNIIGTRMVTVASGVSRVTPTPSVKFNVRFGVSRYEPPIKSEPSHILVEPGNFWPLS